MEKYILTETSVVNVAGITCYQIQAVETFTNLDSDITVNAGDLGGYVQSEFNLSQDGTCWIDEFDIYNNNISVYGANTKIQGDTWCVNTVGGK